MTVADVLTIVFCGFGSVLAGLFGRHVLRTHNRAIEEVVDRKLDPVIQAVGDIKYSLAVQFGGNGGGMREAINKLSIDLAELRGEFHNHIKEAA